MKNIVKTVSLLTIISVIPAAFAAENQRVGITNKVATRLPSIAGYIKAGTTTTTTTTTSATAAYYDVADCVEKYEDCLRAEDVCGSDFQECTTNVLFHAQMPKCSSILYQCTASGVQQLFGTSAINALSTVESYVADDRGRATTEVARYVYPTENSELNNLIAGAKEGNKLTKEQCVRRYTNCLKRDDICGENFELCTTTKEFKKQAMLCDSTFERCPTDAKQELFGSSESAGSLKPSGDSRLKQLIDDGAAYAAGNAVKTCQKVTDNCLINACTKNPLRCVEGISLAEIETADFLGSESGTAGTYNLDAVNDVERYTNTTDASSVRKMLKAQCLETIGSNKYCHMTYLEHKPTDKDLVDIDLQEEVFALAYSARKQMVNPKLQEAVKKFDTNAKNKCVDTIKSCAMRSCGGGLGSVCYRLSRTNSTSNSSFAPITSALTRETYSAVKINGDNTYEDIYSGCSAIVNADANCIYAATSAGKDGYTYTYYADDGEGNTAFNTLFPRSSENKDPIGAVGTLNALLATSYNDAAIEQMKKQCETTALSCVRTMCGTDYINCYRNRTDIVAEGTYSTDQNKLNRSMNKVGGVLDYNIVIGLCMDTVKNSSVCEEHLKVATATWRNSPDGASWNGASSVRRAWNDANTTNASIQIDKSVIVGCRVPNATLQRIGSMANSSLIDINDTDCSATVEPVNGSCNGVVEGNCIYSEPVYMGESEYVLTNGAKTLFQTLLADEEMKVQQLYNAKLTKEQNICTNNNNGGLMGTADNGSTFMWVKLKSNKIPKDYTSKGLSLSSITPSNDLYGSFCRARVTVMSDDKDIQDLLGKYNGSTAYFAVGDSFTCGSWISNKMLEQISEKVGEREVCKAGYGKWVNGECNVKGLSTKEKVTYAWATIAPALAGGAIGTGLTESGLISGLLKKSDLKNSGSTTQKQNKEQCQKFATAASNATTLASCKISLERAQTECAKLRTASGCTDTIKPTDEGDDAALTACKESANAVAVVCDAALDSDVAEAKKTNAARIAIPVVSTLAGGALGAGITASVIKQKKENIQNEAAQKWMDEIGEHIQCYLGTDELGTYGDVVSIELD